MARPVTGMAISILEHIKTWHGLASDLNSIVHSSASRFAHVLVAHYAHLQHRMALAYSLHVAYAVRSVISRLYDMLSVSALTDSTLGDCPVMRQRDA